VTEHTSGPDETARVFQEEAQRNTTRLKNFVESFVVRPGDPNLGATPKDLVWRRGKTQLYRYRPVAQRVKPVPYLMVPWLGISRTQVLDMLPGKSFVEFLVQRGVDVYLLDWGDIAEEDRNLGFADAALKLLPRAIDALLESSQAREITLNGLCVGGTICASYLGLTPDAPVRNFVTIVTPIDFDHGGQFKSWLDERYFPVDAIVQRFGGLPSYLMGSAFKMLRPTLDASAMSSLWFSLDNPEYADSFKAMSRWSNEYIGMPGSFFSTLCKDLYMRNQLLKGEFTLAGRRVDLKKITHPLLVIAAAQDYIVPPLAARGLIEAVSSEDKEYVELPGGHISVFSGRQANETLWPKIDTWLTAHSPAA
jgi:polyhydroxyalkanoate synthase